MKEPKKKGKKLTKDEELIAMIDSAIDTFNKELGGTISIEE